VALSTNDFPKDLPDSLVRVAIPPVLPRSERQWAHQGSRSLFFVGSIAVLKYAHFDNRLAIEWLCLHLSPEIARLDDRVQINIIGASTEQVPRVWQRSNINFLGRADDEEVIRQMTSTDLFIAPIVNNLGAKLKLAQCLAYGTPFVATEAALSGLPFITGVPKIDLRRPDSAAVLVLGYLNDPSALTSLSRLIGEQARQGRIQQDQQWNLFLSHASRTVHADAPSDKQPATP
jgi:glycosyltransferase involved in cell wall biosynthesis